MAVDSKVTVQVFLLGERMPPLTVEFSANASLTSFYVHVATREISKKLIKDAVHWGDDTVMDVELLKADGTAFAMADWNARLSAFLPLPSAAPTNTVTFILKPPAIPQAIASAVVPGRTTRPRTKPDILAAFYAGQSVACFSDCVGSSSATSSPSFVTLRRNRHRWPFVDKTIGIANVLAKERRILFTRPSKFGKSLTLSIMKQMLACGEGGLDVRTEFEGTEILEAITTHGHLGETRLFKDAQIVLSISLARPADDYNKYIIEQLTDQARRFLDSEAVHTISSSSNPYTAMLCLLSYLPTNLRVSILVDEYDSAIIYYLEHDEEPQANRVVDALSSLLMISKDGSVLGERVSHIIVMGIVRVATMNLFSGVNNFADFTHNSGAGEMVGFTEADIRKYFNLTSLSESVKQPVDVIIDTWRQRYNGYCFDGCTTCFNPYQVLVDVHAGALSFDEQEVFPWATKGRRLYGIGFKTIVEGLCSSMRNGMPLSEGFPPWFNRSIDGSTDVSSLLDENVYALLLATGLISIIPDAHEATLLKLSADKVERINVALHQCRMYIPNTLAASVFTQVLAAGTAELLGADYCPPADSFCKAIRTALVNRDYIAFSQLLKEHVQAMPVRLRMIETLKEPLIYAHATSTLLSIGYIPGITISADLAVATGFVDLRITFMADAFNPKETWIIEIGIGPQEFTEREAFQAFLYIEDFRNPLKVGAGMIQLKAPPNVQSHASDTGKTRTAKTSDDDVIVQNPCLLDFTWYDAVPHEIIPREGRAKYTFKLTPTYRTEE